MTSKTTCTEGLPAIVLVAAVAENGVIGSGKRCRGGSNPTCSISARSPWASRWSWGARPSVDRQAAHGPHQHRGQPRSRIRGAGRAGRAEPRAALAAARGDALRRGADAIMVIGGAEIFAQALPLADRLDITEVHAAPQGDTYFPRDRSRRSGARPRARSMRPAAGTTRAFAFVDLSASSRRPRRPR